MKLTPAHPLLFTPLGCPLAFDVCDPESSDPTLVIGRASYVCWFPNDTILYSVQVVYPNSDQRLIGDLLIRHPTSKVKH